MSHPLRMRGLKLRFILEYDWKWSHPLRMRGLKPGTLSIVGTGSCRILCGCVD